MKQLHTGNVMFLSFVTSISHGTIIFISVKYSVGGAIIKAFV